MNDYGADPLGDGTFRMVPSGDIVDFAERNKRLGLPNLASRTPDCIGLTWEQIAQMQGGLNTLDVTRRKGLK